MSTLPEQFSAARQSQAEAQIAFFQNYASTAVASAEKIFALNLGTTRASMEQSSNAVRELLAAQDPRDLLALTNQSQATFDSMLAYGRELFSIATGSQAALLKQATPIVAPSVPEEPKAPSAAPLVAPEAKAKPPVPKAPASVPAKAKPLAKAVGKVAPVVVTTLKAVEAAPPVKAAEPKQLDMLAPKAKKASKK
ncbi:MAG: TIGR01841 family phasin [Pseudomonadota bacterium]